MMGQDGGSGMMQQCMDMMSSMMGGGATDMSAVSSMGANLPLSLVVGLVLVGALGYLLGARRARA
jgi:hypothetical protein